MDSVNEIAMVIGKPVAVGAAAYAIDKWALKGYQSAAFAGVVAGGVLVADQVIKRVGPSNVVAKSIEGRVLEIGGALGGVWALDMALRSGNDNASPVFTDMKRVGAVIASEIVGEYAYNSFYGLA